ncbi:MAG: ABC transporter permease [Candidatus Symbiodolus clandestinus]
MMAYWIAFQTILRKEIIRFTRIWMQTLVPALVNQSLYFIIFGRFIGSQLPSSQGFNYLQFIIPGLMMMSVITNAYGNVSASFFSAKFNRSIEELLVAPVPNPIIILGYVSGGIARGLAIALLVALLSCVFEPWQLHSGWVTFATLLLTALIGSLAGLINGIYANSFDNINIVPTLLLTPLTYLGGIFYSLSRLPPFWQTLSQFNPIVYMVNAVRYGCLGISDIPISHCFAVQISLAMLLTGWVWLLLERGKGLQD